MQDIRQAAAEAEPREAPPDPEQFNRLEVERSSYTRTICWQTVQFIIFGIILSVNWGEDMGTISQIYKPAAYFININMSIILAEILAACFMRRTVTASRVRCYGCLGMLRVVMI